MPLLEVPAFEMFVVERAGGAEAEAEAERVRRVKNREGCRARYERNREAILARKREQREARRAAVPPRKAGRPRVEEGAEETGVPRLVAAI